MPVLTVVIVNWNTKDLLLKCLSSIYKHMPIKEFEVIVVDNASSDGSVEAVIDCFDQVRVIKCSQNRGFAKSNNIAIRESTSPFLLLLNSDTEILPESVGVMMEFMEVNRETGIAGGSLVYPDGTPQLSFYKDPTPLREFYRAFFGEKLDNVINKRKIKKGLPFFTDWIMGSCMFVRREVFDEIGGLDDRVFMYYEDFDLCFRARKAGWKVAYLPQAKIVHHENASGSRKFSSTRLSSSVMSLEFFYTIHFPPTSLKLLKMALLTEAISRIVFFKILYFFKKSTRYLNKIESYRYLLKKNLLNLDR